MHTPTHTTLFISLAAFFDFFVLFTVTHRSGREHPWVLPGKYQLRWREVGTLTLQDHPFKFSTTLCVHIWSLVPNTRIFTLAIASSPGLAQNQEKDLVTFPYVSLCLESCSSITNYYILYLTCASVQNGNKASRLFVNLEFQKLWAYSRLLDY